MEDYITKKKSGKMLSPLAPWQITDCTIETGRVGDHKGSRPLPVTTSVLSPS